MRKKAQIKFGETIGIIIIIYIILMVGLIWYNNYNNKSLREIYNKNLNAKAYEKYQYINNLPLIHSSQMGDIDEEFDLNSLYAMSKFSKLGNGLNYFSNELSFSTISLKIYNLSVFSKINSTNYQDELLLYNYTPKYNYIIIRTPIYKTLIPIHDDVSNKNLIGVLYIKSYITSNSIP